MKSIIITALFVSSIACAHPQVKTASIPDIPTNQYIFNDELLPPSYEANMTVKDHPAPNRPPIAVDENKAYQESIVKIDRAMLAEAAQYSQCYPRKDCATMRKNLCAIDQLIDTRGIIHKKPYCLPSWNIKLH